MHKIFQKQSPTEEYSNAPSFNPTAEEPFTTGRLTCTIFHEELHNFEMAIKTRCSKGCGVGFCGGVDIGSSLHQEGHHA